MLINTPFKGYRIDLKGNVYGKLGKQLKPFIASVGYYYVKIHLDDNETKNISVHRLMYLSFIGSIPDDMVVNHIDGNKLNNLLHNLELVTFSENSIHSFKIGLQRTIGNKYKSNVKVMTQKDINFMYKLHEEGYLKKDIAIMLGTSKRTVSRYFSPSYSRKGIYQNDN